MSENLGPLQCCMFLDRDIWCLFDDKLSNFHKIYVVGAHLNRLANLNLMSTHSIGFYEKISKNIP